MFIAASTAFAQQISYNHIANPDNDEVKEVIALFENYLNSDPAKQEKNVFWNQAVQDKFKKYDFLESEFQPSLYMGFPVHVLSIKSQGGTYEIKAQFAFCKENGEPYILAIVNYYVKEENGALKLYNALTLNRESWKHKNVGMVDFYYPPYHEFDFAKAEKLNEFIVEMCSDLKVEPKPFEYYLADDYDEIQSLKGIDYYLGMGGESIPSGKSAEAKVYCGGMGENYFHEVFHVEIDAYYPNKHPWISEGMATFLGGSRGKDLDWHIERTYEHLKNHPEIDRLR